VRHSTQEERDDYEAMLERKSTVLASEEFEQLESENASLRGAVQGLGELCDQYKTENDKLRKFAKIDTEDIDTMSCLVDDLRAENAKLRELVHKQDALTKAVHAYWAGGERSLDDFNVLMDANAQVLTLMSELGIEVY
jgi:hypothetical protein